MFLKLKNARNTKPAVTTNSGDLDVQKAGEEYYTAEEVKNKILELNSALKKQLRSIRKPLPYTDDKDIKLYLEDFECYGDVVGLAKEAPYKTFLSYLPDKHRIRLSARSFQSLAKGNLALNQRQITNCM